MWHGESDTRDGGKVGWGKKRGEGGRGREGEIAGEGDGAGQWSEATSGGWPWVAAEERAAEVRHAHARRAPGRRMRVHGERLGVDRNSALWRVTCAVTRGAVLQTSGVPGWPARSAGVAHPNAAREGKG